VLQIEADRLAGLAMQPALRRRNRRLGSPPRVPMRQPREGFYLALPKTATSRRIVPLLGAVVDALK
jgi:hypothetical protein